MQKRIRALVLVLTCLFITGMAQFARGPIGTYLSKEVPQRLDAAVLHIGATTTQMNPIPPESVELEFALSLKRALKVIASSLGIFLEEFEYANEYTIAAAGNKTSIRCLVRYRGDHLIGMALRHGPSGIELSRQLRDALSRELPGMLVVVTGSSSEPPPSDPRQSLVAP